MATKRSRCGVVEMALDVHELVGVVLVGPFTEWVEEPAALFEAASAIGGRCGRSGGPGRGQAPAVLRRRADQEASIAVTARATHPAADAQMAAFIARVLGSTR